MIVTEEYAVEMIKLILSMTFTGSIISFFLFILKPFMKDKLPKSFQYYMWLSVVIALILPVSKIIVIPVSSNSAIFMEPMHDIVQWISEVIAEKPINFLLTSQNENGQNIQQNTYFANTVVMLFVLWQLGVVLILGFNIISYVTYILRLNKYNISADRQEIELMNDLLERKNTLRLYKNSMVKIPILIGFCHPAVILPDKKYENMRLRNILMHEITHMKRHDIFVKWLLIFVGAIHWFNPLIYFVRREMSKACELACDESVIKRFNTSEMQQYGDTLIEVAADSIRKRSLLITMFEDKKELKERLDAIMKHKKYTKRTVIAASIILVTIVCTILGFSTLHSIENEYKNRTYADNYPLQQDQKRIKEIELKKALYNYDTENIAQAYVFLSDLGGEITNAYITVICQEKNPDSEMQNEIKSLASEELELDIQNIYIDYMDFDSFTSNERASK